MSGAAKYLVYYKTSGNWKKIAYTTGTSYTWTGAKTGTTYAFTVKGFDASGAAGAYDNTGVSVTHLATPVLSTARNTAGGVEVKWKAVDGAEQYRVFYKTTGGWKKLADTTGTKYVWEKAQSGVDYTFTVRCLSADKRCYTSSYDTDGVGVCCLTAPAITEAANTADGVRISWKAVPGAAKYLVYYKTSGGWKKIAYTTGTSYTWTGAKTGTEYAFTVKGFSVSGTAGAYDNTGVSMTHLATPELGSARNTTGGVEITWKAVPGAEQYRVFYKTTGGWKKLADTTETTYIWETAQSGVDYTFAVRCLSADKRSYTSSYDTDGVSVFCLTAPALNKPESMANGIRVSWDAVPGTAKYLVYYKTSGNWKKIAYTTKTSYTWTGAESGTEYTFTVKSVDKNGTAGPYDKVGKTGVYFAAPELESARSTTDGVEITWKAVPGVQQYRVFYKTTGGWKKLADTTGTEYVWKTATSGLSYAFTVRCLSADKSSYTSTYDKTGKSVKYIATPVLDRPSSEGKTIQVSWNAVPGAAKYLVYCKTDGNWKKIASTKKTTYTVEGLSTGVVYTFTVRASAADGTLSSYTDGERTMLFTNSPLVSYTRISPNKDPVRNNIIDTITIHCTAGQCSVETLGAIFAPTSKAASSNYGVGSDGRIGMYVEEKDCSWCSSNRPNDNRAITIEVSSDSYEPYWVTPAAYASMLDLVTDICWRNGIKRLVWSDSKEDRVNHLNGCNMTCHRDYYPKSCPGTYLYSREGQIAAEVNARLAAMAGE